MSVRAAQPGDARAVAEVHVRTWQAAYRHAFPPELLDELSVDSHERRWREMLEGDAQRAWVAVDGDRVVGFAAAGTSRAEEGVAELYALYVEPGSWGTPAARDLMATVIAWFRTDGYATAILWVLEDNPRARRFYEREGWRFDRVEWNEVRGVQVRSALYRLSLAKAQRLDTS